MRNDLCNLHFLMKIQVFSDVTLLLLYLYSISKNISDFISSFSSDGRAAAREDTGLCRYKRQRN